MEFRMMLTIVKRWAVVLLLAGLLAGAAGLYVSTLVAPTYASSARILVGPVSADFETGRAATTNVVTYAELLTSEPILLATIDSLGSELTTNELRQQIEVEGDQTSRIITVTAEAPDAELAATTANVLAEQLAVVVPPAEEAPGGSVSVISPAIVDAEPVWPTPTVMAILSAIGGLAAALIVLILIESADRRVRSPDDLDAAGAGPLLGRVRVRRPLQPAPPGSPASVQYHSEASSLIGRLVTERPTAATSLVVPSVDPGDESAELAVSLAAAAADGGWRVLLIDADDVAHQVSRVYPGVVAPRPGAVAEGASLSGERAASSTRRGDAASRLAAAEEEGWDVVVIHVGPLDRSRTALEWAAAADLAVIASRSGTTQVDDLRTIADTLRRVGTPLAGTAIVEAGRRRRRPTRDGSAIAMRPVGGGSGDGGADGMRRGRSAAKDSART